MRIKGLCWASRATVQAAPGQFGRPRRSFPKTRTPLLRNNTLALRSRNREALASRNKGVTHTPPPPPPPSQRSPPTASRDSQSWPRQLFNNFSVGADAGGLIGRCKTPGHGGGGGVGLRGVSFVGVELADEQ